MMAIFQGSFIVSAFALVFYVVSIDAHITMSPKYVEPMQNIITAFHIPHGCNGSATIGLTVTVPDAVTVAIPLQVSNWNLAVTYHDSTNTTIETITWSGGYLAPTDALDFPMNVSVPNEDLSSQTNVTLYFSAIQKCQVGVSYWQEVTVDGVTSGQGETSPSLVVVNNATEATDKAITITSSATTSSSASSATASTANIHSHNSASTKTFTGFMSITPIVIAVLALL